MKVKITLKEPQKECLDKVKSDLSLENHEKTIHKLIHGIFELNQDDEVFGDYRCVGDCYSTDQSVKIELDDETHSLSPGMAILIKPGCRHRAVGEGLKILNIPVPKFNPDDEWLD